MYDNSQIDCLGRVINFLEFRFIRKFLSPQVGRKTFINHFASGVSGNLMLHTAWTLGTKVIDRKESTG
jgi:hypothetical protein